MTIAYSGDSITFPDNSVQNTAPSGFGFKNRIINGAMVIDQRNAGASVTPADGAYTLDRWRAGLSQASKLSVQQNAGAVTPPSGFKNYLGVTSLSAYALTGSDVFMIQQKMEGYNVSDLMLGTASAATFTVSFLVRSSLTGLFGACFINGAGDRSYPFSYTISAANTWEQKSITLVGDTSGTWLTTNGTGLELRFSMGGSGTYVGTVNTWGTGNYVTPTGCVSVVGTNAATWQVTGVQLEKGSTATSFDYRPYGTELGLCQRYCYTISLTAAGDFGVGACTSGGVQAFVPYPVTMRSAPTVTFATAGNFVIADGTAGYTVTSTGTTNITTNQTTANMGASGTTGGRAGMLRWNTGTAFILSSAEL